MKHRWSVTLRSYSKAIFFYPLLLTSVFCWVSSWLVQLAEWNRFLGILWFVIFFFCLMIVAFDFSSLRFILLLILVGVIAAIIIPLLIFFGILEMQFLLDIFNIVFTFEFYVWMSIILLIFLGIIWFGRRFNYTKIERNEIYLKSGLFSSAERLPTKNMRLRKEIPDVLEFFLLRAGRITLMPGHGDFIPLNHVANVNKKQEQIDWLLSHIPVEMVGELLPEEIEPKFEELSKFKPNPEVPAENVEAEIKKYPSKKKVEYQINEKTKELFNKIGVDPEIPGSYKTPTDGSKIFNKPGDSDMATLAFDNALFQKEFMEKLSILNRIEEDLKEAKEERKETKEEMDERFDRIEKMESLDLMQDRKNFDKTIQQLRININKTEKIKIKIEKGEDLSQREKDVISQIGTLLEMFDLTKQAREYQNALDANRLTILKKIDDWRERHPLTAKALEKTIDYGLKLIPLIGDVLELVGI